MTSREYLNGLFGLVEKESARWIRTWVQCLVPPAITMTLYFLIFGHVIGSRIGTMGGIPYMDYLLPGLVMLPVITNSYGNVVHSVFLSKMLRYIEELWVSPMPYFLIVLGYQLGGILRGLVTGIIVLLIGMFFTGRGIEHPIMTIFTIITCAGLFSLVGMINGIVAKTFDDTTIITTFILTPLIYLGGVFYTLDRLPAVWQVLSQFNPIYYIVELFRYATVGQLNGHDSYLVLFGIIWALIVITFFICWAILRNGKWTKP